MSFRQEFIDKLDSDDRLFECDVLNMLLSNAYGGKDMSTVAKRLLARFPSIRAIAAADYDQLKAVDGVTDGVALYLMSFDKLLSASEPSGGIVKSSDDCIDLVRGHFGDKDSEWAEFIFINRANKVIEVKKYSSSLTDRVNVPLKNIMAMISVSKAYGLYFVHNHVNFPPLPSKTDDISTAKIALACDACGIKFFDHIIFGEENKTYSYKSEGRIEEVKRLYSGN
ncbi:MAG: hypothetical protein K2N47_00615 [Clostridia bacterium]|nr:hypothetical protein [Clostridia bacterium]